MGENEKVDLDELLKARKSRESLACGTHLPGPYEFVIDGDSWPMIISSLVDEEGVRLPVVDLFHGGYDFADRGYPLEATGRVLAAAPELLEALGLVTECLEQELEGLLEGGLDEDALIGWLGEDYGRRVISARMRIGQAHAAIAKVEGRDA